jgi:hypothetical protein
VVLEVRVAVPLDESIRPVGGQIGEHLGGTGGPVDCQAPDAILRAESEDRLGSVL